MVVFRLYIVNGAPNSLRAIHNLTEICEEYLPNNYRIEVIDVAEEPLRALAENVLLTPMLVKMSPAPTWRLVGDLSDKHKLVVLGLGDNVPDRGTGR